MEHLTTAFQALLTMALAALPVMAAVLAVRLLLRKAPRRFAYLLWAVVAFRLLCPVSVESPVGLVLLFPPAILHEASITFLGFGLSPEQPAIGIILSESMRYLSMGKWWLALFPGALLVVTVALFDYMGRCLRRLTDVHSLHA